MLDVLIRQGDAVPGDDGDGGGRRVGAGPADFIPAGWARNQLAAPISYDNDAEPFRRPDLVLVNRWAFALAQVPRPGDVVLFRPTIRNRVAADY